MNHTDPVTGDALTLGEWASWRVQGIIRRWTFLVCITILTVGTWTLVAVKVGPGLRAGPVALLTWWNLAASYLALLIEGTVGIAMFSQTRRDAVLLRKIAALEDRSAQVLDDLETVLHQHRAFRRLLAAAHPDHAHHLEDP